MDKTWLMNSIGLLIVLGILWNLGAALRALLFDHGASDKMLRALLQRVALSVLLFIVLLGAVAAGWIEVHTPYRYSQN